MILLQLLIDFIHVFTVIDAELLPVLNIDRSEFNKNVLGKTYRKLAAQYHPDKVADVEAEEKFRQIATAYETLKDDETRADYDYYLDHPEQRAYNYYQYYRRRVAPKVDARIVVVVTVILISVFQFLSAAQKHKEALDYAVKQEKYRNAAKEIAKERGISLEGDFRDRKSRKEYAEQVLRQIIEENVDVALNESHLKIHSTERFSGYRGGYKKPSIYNTLSFNDNERSSLFKNELWDSVKFAEWKAAKEDEQKERLAASGRYKRYRRYMKNQQSSLPVGLME
ncbi:DnaJ-like protein dnj-2 [Dirofilaria immitis]|nr:DnaJ-like protein dnj-2 [Dirofilaria immitis]